MTRQPLRGYSGYPRCGGIVPAATLASCMVADCPAAGFLPKDELSAAAILRILGRA